MCVCVCAPSRYRMYLFFVVCLLLFLLVNLLGGWVGDYCCVWAFVVVVCVCVCCCCCCFLGGFGVCVFFGFVCLSCFVVAAV